MFRVLKMEAKMDQLRTLVEAADKDKVDLVNQLEEERRSASQVNFIFRYRQTSVGHAKSLIFFLNR